MTTMIAEYIGGKKLNVRSEPSQKAAVVRKMAPGEQAECSEVRGGWVKLHEGYVSAEYVLVKLGEAIGEVGDAAAEAVEAVNQAAEVAPIAPESDDDEAAALRAMTVTQLRDLAEQSGVKLAKNMKKDAIIAAILADE